MATDAEKQEWVLCYTRRILASFEEWKTPLGVGADYAEDLKKHLTDSYDDPLKKELIETTY